MSYRPPAYPPPRRRWSTAALAITATLAFLAGVLVVTGISWTQGSTTTSAATSATVTATTTVQPPESAPDSATSDSTSPVTPTPEGAVSQSLLEAAVAAALTVGGGSAGIAVDDGTGLALNSGYVDGMVSWSAIKVPLAIAALRQNPGLYDTTFAAITYSDNGAAQALWDALGAGDAAATAVAEVVGETGQSLAVNPYVTRPGYTAFGQTLWSLPEMAYFGARLNQVTGSQQVLDMMSQVVADQSYGLGTLPSAQFKGGWGPTEAGGYTTRQFGRVRLGGNGDGTGGTVVGIAIYAAPADGSYATSQAMLTAMAEELQ
ncbi:MAG: hypothetical protein SPI77_07630 [Corynebacterium sp.]|nr:hypothetical protein [Corynebacterium sp.]